ncbi:MAG TPA: hypothetical protein VEY07_08270, partial [Thermoplasmata archaeon]|nr:hypothetical protein [Thermoplasmata archaeon]
EAIRTGGATFALVLIVPVVTGTSPWLAVGALLIVAGIGFIPWAWSSEYPPESDRRRGGSPEPTAVPSTPRSGGFVLIGPLPLFFGGWKHPTRVQFWSVVALGSALLVVTLLVVWFVLG